MTFAVLLSLAIALQVMPPPQTTSGAGSATQKPATAQTSGSARSARPGSVVLTVTSEAGELLSGAMVTAHGAVDRAGVTGADGLVTLQTMPAGIYRCRITRDGFIMLDKEVTVRAGARTTAEGVLAAAPPPPPAPAPPPPVETRAAPPPTGTAGAPSLLSIPDLAEVMLRDSQPIVERQIGCSGLASSRLILARETIALHRNPDFDEMLYVVAGEATLTLAETDKVVTAGWFGLVPRGTSYSLVRRGRNPIVVLSMQSGQPCGGGE